MQNENEILTPLPEDSGSVTMEDVDASIKRAMSEMGINEDFLNPDVDPSTYAEFFITLDEQRQQALRARLKQLYIDLPSDILKLYEKKMWADQQYVGDEQGMLHPREPKAPITLWGEAFASIRSSGFMSKMIVETVGRETCELFQKLFPEPERKRARGESEFFTTHECSPYYKTATPYPDRTVRKKSASAIKRDKAKRQKTARRKNRK